MATISAPVLFTVLLGSVFPLMLPAPLPAQEAAGMHHAHVPAAPSIALAVHAGTASATLSLADLQAMPQTTVTVFNAHNKQNETYAGPLVSDVLAKAGVALSEETQHAILDSYVIAAGTDGYFVLFSGAELQPGLHKPQTIIALTQAGQPLGQNGAFQLIDTGEVKPARWVRNLTSLTVVPVTSPTP